MIQGEPLSRGMPTSWPATFTSYAHVLLHFLRWWPVSPHGRAGCAPISSCSITAIQSATAASLRFTINLRVNVVDRAACLPGCAPAVAPPSRKITGATLPGLGDQFPPEAAYA
jgi:hypothetical protein